MISRRKFLKQLAVGTACAAAAPVLLAGTPPNDKLDQIFWRIGEFVRDRSIKPSSVIAIDEVGRLVLTARTDMETDRVFYLANREGEYTRLAYCVEHRFLDRAAELSVFVHAENGCHKFPLVFT